MFINDSCNFFVSFVDTITSSQHTFLNIFVPGVVTNDVIETTFTCVDVIRVAD